MRAKASSAFSSGYVSIIGLTPVSELNLSVSSESMPVPEGQPATVRRPISSGNAFTDRGPSSVAPTTINLPAGASPSSAHSSALALVSVYKITFAPPNFFSSSAGFCEVLSM